MQIVDEEDDRAAGDSRRGCRSGCGVWIIESRDLEFTRTARRDPLEERHRPRLTVDHQLKLLTLQSFDEVAFLVENRNRGLYQFGIGPDNILTFDYYTTERDDH